MKCKKHPLLANKKGVMFALVTTMMITRTQNSLAIHTVNNYLRSVNRVPDIQIDRVTVYMPVD